MNWTTLIILACLMAAVSAAFYGDPAPAPQRSTVNRAISTPGRSRPVRKNKTGGGCEEDKVSFKPVIRCADKSSAPTGGNRPLFARTVSRQPSRHSRSRVQKRAKGLSGYGYGYGSKPRPSGDVEPVDGSRRRPRPRPQPVYFDDAPEDDLPDGDVEPENESVSDGCSDGGDVEPDNDSREEGCGGGGRGGRGGSRPSGGVRPMRATRPPRSSEVCRGKNGLRVVLLVSEPEQIKMVCASIGGRPAAVTDSNEEDVKKTIKKCLRKEKDVLVASWFGDKHCASLAYVKKGKLKRRSDVDDAPVLCRVD